MSFLEQKKHNSLIVKYDSKLKFGKIFNGASEFPEDDPNAEESKDIKNEDFDLHIKKDPDQDIKPEYDLP